MLVEVFSDVAEGNDDLQDKLPTAVLQILVISFVSISIGLIVGLSSAYAYKHLNLRQNPEGEIALFIVVALLPYYVAEVLGFSGICTPNKIITGFLIIISFPPTTVISRELLTLSVRRRGGASE